MKKIIITVALVLGIGATSFAQSKSDTTVVHPNKCIPMLEEYTTPSGKKGYDAYFEVDGENIPSNKTSVERARIAIRFKAQPIYAIVKSKSGNKRIIVL